MIIIGSTKKKSSKVVILYSWLHYLSKRAKSHVQYINKFITLVLIIHTVHELLRVRVVRSLLIYRAAI